MMYTIAQKFLATFSIIYNFFEMLLMKLGGCDTQTSSYRFIYISEWYRNPHYSTLGAYLGYGISKIS